MHLLYQEVYLWMFKEGFGRLMFERKLYFWLILGGGTYHVPQRGGSIHTLYTREWKEPIYCDIFGSRARLFKPLFEIGSIQVLTDYMYGKSSLCLPHNNLNINGGFILWFKKKEKIFKVAKSGFHNILQNYIGFCSKNFQAVEWIREMRN